MGENTVKALMKFSLLPKPNSIQSGNGSHFTAVVQKRAKEEGVWWVFHTLCYAQANGIVEQSNGLLNKFLKLENPDWSAHLSDAVKSKRSLGNQ